MITYWLILAHLFGDYVLQSDWMATHKTKSVGACLAHAVAYTLPFAFLTQDWAALLFISSTHFVIDHWRLARYVVWAKNYLSPPFTLGETLPEGAKIIEDEAERCSAMLPDGNLKMYAIAKDQTYHEVLVQRHPWKDCQPFGYPKDRPVWLVVWLLIIADNAIHLFLNGMAFVWWVL